LDLRPLGMGTYGSSWSREGKGCRKGAVRASVENMVSHQPNFKIQTD